MTQIHDMTNTQLNRELAEKMFKARKCGRDTDSRVVIIGDFGEYNTHPLTGGWKQANWRATEEEAWADIPNYAGDPAASLEVQAKALVVNAALYLKLLSARVYGTTYANVQEYDLIQLIEVKRLLLASPRERAMAAWMTLKNLRKEEG